jgi:hypothetical protein
MLPQNHLAGEQIVMSEGIRILGHWQKAESSRGDIIIDLRPEIVDSLNLQVGGVLIVEGVDGLVPLRPKSKGWRSHTPSLPHEV